MKQTLFAFCSFLVASVPILYVSGNTNLLLQLIHLLIALICSFSLFRYANRPYSLHKMVNIFFLFFLCIAPIIQYSEGVVIWGGAGFSDGDYILTSFCVLLSLLVYEITYYYVTKSTLYKRGEPLLTFLSSDLVVSKKVNKLEGIGAILLLLLILFAVLYMNHFNLMLIFFRGVTNDMEEVALIETANEVEVAQSVGLIIDDFLRPLAVALFLFLYLQKAPKMILFLSGILLLLIAFPLAMARFKVAALYIPFVILFIPLFKRKNVFVLSAIVGLLVVFPSLNNFRRFSDQKDLEFGLDFEMFTEGHFDTYSSFMRVLANDIVTFGHQILGSFLFWVPRSIWPDKPIGSGAFLHELLDLEFDNISCCYLAEGYINGGFLGLFLFVVLLGIVTAFFDDLYWKVFINNNQGLYQVGYFMLLGLIFFIMRGDLLSSFAYTVGFLTSVMCVYVLFLFIRKYRIKLY